MKISHHIWPMLLAALFASPALAQTSRLETPPLVQVTLGPTLGDLPGFGSMYCGPTATTMELLWLGSNGFSTLAPTNYDQNNPADLPLAYNLDLVIAGMMGTTPLGGTANSGFEEGLSMYLNLQGFSGLYSTPANELPTSSTLSTYLTGYNIDVVNISWFKKSDTTITTDQTVYNRISGHDVALLSASGTTNAVVVNNPEPASFAAVLNTATNVQQSVTTGTIPNGIYLSGTDGQLDANLQFITPKHPGTAGSESLAVITSVNVVQFSGSLDLSTFTPQTFNVDHEITINTNGGSFTTAAPIVSDFTITKTGSGTMTLGNTVQGSGGFDVTGGGLESTTTNAGATPVLPFGGGDIRLEGGGLTISPAVASGGNAQILIASGSNRTLTIDAGGNLLALNRGGNTTLAVQIGGHNGDGEQNLLFGDYGTLQIQASDGPTGLGSTTKLTIVGSGSNLPIQHNGIVTPAIVAQQNNADASGVFLSYSASNGFVRAATTNGDSFSGADDTTIFQTTGNIDLTGTATVAALIANNTVTGDTLQIAPDGAPYAGLILNNGAEINTAALEFGDRTAFIYSSNGGGTISSSIHSGGSIATFGPGQLTLSGTNTSIGGGVYVNSGTLAVANSGVGTAAVTVNNAATLRITGVVSGTVTATAGSTVLLSGGTMTSAPNLSTASTLGGTGLVRSSGNLTLAGNIGSSSIAGQLTFQSTGTITVATGADATLNFTLTNLTSGTSAFGNDWSGFIFVDDVVIGTDADPVTIGLNFSSVSDPDDPSDPSGFWAASQSWRFLEFDDGYTWSGSNYKFISNAYYSGIFSLELVAGATGDPSYVNLTYTPLPEPAAWMLASLGLIILFLLRRQKKANTPVPARSTFVAGSETGLQ